MEIEWVDGFKISIRIHSNNEVTISANKEGLLSLANQLKALAGGEPGNHIHYDEYNSLETRSSGMIIEKVK